MPSGDAARPTRVPEALRLDVQRHDLRAGGPTDADVSTEELIGDLDDDPAMLSVEPAPQRRRVRRRRPAVGADDRRADAARVGAAVDGGADGAHAGLLLGARGRALGDHRGDRSRVRGAGAHVPRRRLSPEPRRGSPDGPGDLRPPHRGPPRAARSGAAAGVHRGDRSRGRRRAGDRVRCARRATPAPPPRRRAAAGPPPATPPRTRSTRAAWST